MVSRVPGTFSGAAAVEMQTAFVLARNEDAAQITRALRGAGYRAVDPVELDEVAGLKRRYDKDAADVVARDLTVLMECDLVVMGPDCEKLPWAVALAATAGTRKMAFERIEVLVPGWAQA
jgi:hypothetical protein